MQVTVYSDACYNILSQDERFEGAEAIHVEIDLADFNDVPTAADIHALMNAEHFAAFNIPIDTDEGITIVEGTDPMWEWFEGEDPSNWTITQAWEFDQEVERVHSSSIEEFGLFITNYWNVRNQGTSGLLDAFHDSYRGTYEDGQTYAEELFGELNDGVDMSVWPFTCLDWEAAWDELEVSGDNTGYETQSGQLAIFCNNF